MVTCRRSVILALVALLLVGLTPVAMADGASPNADDAAIWLSRQPMSDLDQTDRIDRILALEIAGVSQPVMDQLLEQVEFIATDPDTLTTATLAKMIIVLDAAGRSPQQVGGSVNLVDKLNGRLFASKLSTGIFQARFGEELATQSWAIIALARLGLTPGQTVTYLLSRQCPEGDFVMFPGPRECVDDVQLSDQTIILNALIAASAAAIDVGQSPEQLRDWLINKYDDAYGMWPDFPASALGLGVFPLEAMGNDVPARAATRQIESLQLDSRVALHAGQVGAIAGENAQLKSQVLAQGLAPDPEVTAQAMFGLVPTNLHSFHYQPRGSLTSMTPSGASVVGPREAVGGDKLTFLVQGFQPGETVQVLDDGNNLIADEVADDHGSLVIKFSAPCDSGSCKVNFGNGSKTLATASVLITKVRIINENPGVLQPEVTTNPGSAHRLLPLWQFKVITIALIVLAIVIGALLLREPRRSR